MPKPGWQIETVRGEYGKTYTMYHSTVSEGVKEMAWTGRLADEHYDELVLSAYLTDDLVPGQTLYFPVVQECETGVNRWIEILSGRQDRRRLQGTRAGRKAPSEEVSCSSHAVLAIAAICFGGSGKACGPCRRVRNAGLRRTVRWRRRSGGATPSHPNVQRTGISAGASARGTGRHIHRAGGDV